MKSIRKLYVNYLQPRILFYRSPWGKALLTAAARLYRESDRWRERVQVLGMDYADMAFYTSSFEIMWFKRLVLKDKRLMAKILITPFSVKM